MEHTSITSIPFDSPQAFRPIYKNQIPGINLPQDIVYISPQLDPECGLYVIFLDKVMEKFKDVIRIRRPTTSVPFVKDMDRKNLYPLRLNIAVGVTFDVIMENPTESLSSPQHSDTSNITERELPIGDQISSSLESRNPFLDPMPNDDSTFEGLLQNLDSTSGIGLTYKKAIGGDAESQVDIGVIYASIHKNYDKAMKWYLKAAEQGHVVAQYSIGHIYLKGDGFFLQDYKKANEWFVISAEKNNVLAQTAIGYLYHEGKNYPRNPKAAMEWYLKADKQNCLTAAMNIGILYGNGEGVTRDDSKSMEWYTKSAEQGNTSAQAYLGSLYKWGKSVPKCQHKAEEWFLLAAHQGHESAQEWLSTHYSDMNDDSLSLKWQQIAARQGSNYMQYNLGLSFSIGKGAPLNYPTAMKWLHIAAKGEIELRDGKLPARNLLGRIYESGYGVPEDFWMAKELYLQASLLWTARVRLATLKRKEKKKCIF
ncbi:hypothetical protein BGZ76_011203 [Entomortierella beljakovae]|nr:hypothetical protein BGZ76_011203 [Entomortierella beljakovae]